MCRFGHNLKGTSFIKSVRTVCLTLNIYDVIIQYLLRISCFVRRRWRQAGMQQVCICGAVHSLCVPFVLHSSLLNDGFNCYHTRVSATIAWRFLSFRTEESASKNVATNKLNSGQPARGGHPVWGLDQGLTNPRRKSQQFTKYTKERRAWTDHLEWEDNIKMDLQEVRWEGAWTGLIRLRTGTGGVLLWTRERNFGSYKTREISCLAEELLACQEGLLY